jgi:hypothetical protein
MSINQRIDGSAGPKTVPEATFAQRNQGQKPFGSINGANLLQEKFQN